MSPLLWLDSVAYGFSMVIATALALTVLAAGPRHAVNRLFALFAITEAVWAAFSLLLRMTLWLSVGDPALHLEVATLAFSLMGPLLLLFTVRYVGRSTRWADRAAILGMLAMAALSVPLFRHQILFNPHLGLNDIPTYAFSAWGILAASLPALYMIWSVVIFWQERHQTGEPFLALSVLVLLTGFAIGGLFNPPLPVMSITTTSGILILGYGIVSRQLLNPLQELANELESRVEQRTQELSETAARLEKANVRLTRRGVQLEAAAQVAREASAIRNVDELLKETVYLISERFGFYHSGIFLNDEAGEYAVLRAASSEGGQRMLERRHKLKIGAVGIVGFVAATGQSRVALDTGEDAVFFDNPDLPLTRSEMALPLKIRGHVTGVLDVQSTEAAAFSDEDVATLQTMADQLALAIENARLLEVTIDQLREVSGLLGRSAREGWERLAAERPGWGYVYDGVEVLPREGTRVEEQGHRLTVPLQLRGEPIGQVDLVLEGRVPNPEEEAVVRAVVEQASLALENARLYQYTQRRAIRERLTREITDKMRRATSVEDIVRTTVDELSRALGASRTFVQLGTAPSKSDTSDDGNEKGNH